MRFNRRPVLHPLLGLFLVFGPIYISEPAVRRKPDIMNYCAFEPDEEKRGCVFRPHPRKILD
jgi:hypothetical protein